MRGKTLNIKPALTGASHLLAKRVFSPFWIRRAWLKKTEALSPESIRELQLSLLRRTLTRAYAGSSFYRKAFDGIGFDPRISELADMERLPILSKTDILRAQGELENSRYRKALVSEGLTGGTTGTPLRIRRSLSSVGNEHAFVRRQWSWAGIGLGDRTAYLSGRQVVSPEQKGGKLYSYDPFMRELILSNYHLSRDSAPSFIEAMRRYGVKALVGYASSIHYFSNLARELGADLGLKAVLTTSETLDEGMRSDIESSLGARVYDFYGAAERVCYIFTCREGRYHIQEDYGYTELVPEPDHPDGKVFRIVSTGFWNDASPFIRYDSGDLVEASGEPCPCGCAFRTVKRISGRAGAFVRTKSGKRFSTTLMARVSKMTHNVLQTQIVQDCLDSITVTYVPGAAFSQADLDELRGNMRAFLPSELGIEFKRADSVIRTKSGKMNLIVSRLA